MPARVFHFRKITFRKRPVIIAVYINKGGAGKTTTATGLAWMFGTAGYKVLLVDANARQPSATMIYNAQMKRGQAPYDLATEEHPELLGQAAKLPYEIIIMDCPPDDLAAKAALEVADLVVVPFNPKPLETQALMHTIKHILGGKPYRILFALIPYRLRGKPSAQTTYALKSQVGRVREALTGMDVPMFDTLIREYSVHEACVATGYPVWTAEAQEAEPTAVEAGIDYAALYEEVLPLLAGRN